VTLAVSVVVRPGYKLIYGEAEILATGFGLTDTTVDEELFEHPLELVTVTEYEPELETVIDCVVAALLHNHELPADAVSTTLPPWQMARGPPAVILAAGVGFTTTVVTGELLIQPLACVTATERL
jgi:hypothetical protein